MKISISVSQNFKNQKLDELLSKNDNNVNESILNYGVLLHLNEANILKNLNNENETKVHLEEINILTKKFNDEKHTIMQLKQKEVNDILSEKQKEFNELFMENKKLHENFIKKEKQIQNEFIEKEESLRSEKNQLIDYYKQREVDFRQKIIEYEEKIKKDKDEYIEKIKSEYSSQIDKVKNEYSNELKDLSNTIKNLRNENHLLEEQKNSNITALINNGRLQAKEELEKNYQMQFNHYNEVKINLENTINELKSKINELEKESKQLTTEKCDLLLKLSDKNTSEIASKITEDVSYLKNNMSKYFSDNNNTARGEWGENFIENFLSENFPGASIINTSQFTSFGDIYYERDGLKLLVESKNVKNLKKEDFTKFLYDIDYRCNKQEINAGLFICLLDNSLVNNVRKFYFEMHNGVPCIYIGDVSRNPFSIKFAIDTLTYLVKNGFTKFDNEDERISFLCESLNRIHNNFIKENDYLEKDKKHIEALLQNINNRRNNLIEISNVFDELIRRYPEMQPPKKLEDKKQSEEEKFNKFVDLVVEHKSQIPAFIIKMDTILTIPKINEAGYTLSYIKNVSLKKIKDEVEKKLLIIQMQNNQSEVLNA